ncbi:hypothetical protein F2Q68_00009620 [Brassica cretica]|uniref:Uncharacterized protein n=1 Tax=Brassica cretica TaxID=69181 RepID=A0A8S9KUF1_BRACR|nr:hypothetical protein F2Q68_00009620 [Brassica cretica]
MERWVAMYLLRYTVVTVHWTVQKPLERDRRLNLYRHFCVLMDRDAYYSPRWLRSRSSGRGSGVNILKVGLTGIQAVAKLNGGFGASLGSSERTRERTREHEYGRVPCTDWINSVWMRGVGSSGLMDTIRTGDVLKGID